MLRAGPPPPGEARPRAPAPDRPGRLPPSRPGPPRATGLPGGPGAGGYTDTVGFVRRLPHQLVDAFRSTLEEVVQADLAPHVVDASSPEATEHVATVRGVLREIGAGDVPELLVPNKADVADPERTAVLRRAHPGALAVSARTGEGLDDLRTAPRERLRPPARPTTGTRPHAGGTS
ncbi:hypothetical protein ACPF8X_13750 [Streptomyces sp. G35A]